MVARTLIRPPSSRLGPATEAERQATLAASPVRGLYDTPVNRESAHELLTRRAEQTAATQAEAKAAEAREAAARRAPAPTRSRERAAPAPRRSNRQTPMEALTKSVLRQAGSTITREVLRGVLGSLRRR